MIVIADQHDGQSRSQMFRLSDALNMTRWGVGSLNMTRWGEDSLNMTWLGEDRWRVPRYVTVRLA